MNVKSLRSADLFTGIILALGSIAVLINSYGMTLAVLAKGHPIASSPGFVPAVAAILMLAMSLSLLLRGVKDGGTLSFLHPAKISKGIASLEGRNIITVLGIIGSYIFILLKFLPYSIATFIFLYVFILLYYKKEYLRVAAIAALTSLVITIAFGMLADIPLPGKSIVFYIGNSTLEIP